MIKSLGILLPLLLALGCANPFKDRPSDDQLAEAESKNLHGPRPDNFEEKIKGWMRANLKDPDSVKDLNIDPPAKGWMFAKGALLRDERLAWGWICRVSFNAKNSYGGYTGLKTRNFFMRSDSDLVLVTGNE